MSRKVVFLDRDGTINLDRGYVYRAEDWEFLPQAVEAIARLRQAGYAVAVVTNQSGIAEGYYTLDDVQTLHDWMQQQLAAQNTQVDAIAFCPHNAQDNCQCRKPLGGMAQQIQQQLDCEIDYPASWMVGDKLADIGFGKTLGTRTALLPSRYWTQAELTDPPDLLAESLWQVVEVILQDA